MTAVLASLAQPFLVLVIAIREFALWFCGAVLRL